MSTDMTWQTKAISLDASLLMAEHLGSKLQGGETIELISDLGGGKTTFTQGLVKGLGSTDQVSSPSFTLMNQYQAGPLTICHFDFYRLAEPGIMRQELAEVMADDKTITIIEWADVVEDILPTSRLSITITADGEASRQYDFRYDLAYQPAIEALQSLGDTSV